MQPEEILDFWFQDAATSAKALESRSAIWFGRDADFDRKISERFAALPERAGRGELTPWRGEARSALALVLVVDQFTRNLFRDSGRAFEFDPLAREVALESIARNFDDALQPVEAAFLYLPLEHAEDLDLQQRCVRLFEALEPRAPAGVRERFEAFTDYARRHRDVVERFGRFPHRNRVLNREPTAEEVAYLDAGGDTFG